MNDINVLSNEVLEEELDVDETAILLKKYNMLIIERAVDICTTYSSGNGKFNKNNLPNINWSNHIQWLTAYAVYQLSKNDEDIIDLINTKAVSKKHSLLLAKHNTGKYDFTSLLATCLFINKIDTNTQSFTFKRESKTCTVNLKQLESQLALLGLELITEETTTRSGGKLIEYFYDVKVE